MHAARLAAPPNPLVKQQSAPSMSHDRMLVRNLMPVGLSRSSSFSVSSSLLFFAMKLQAALWLLPFCSVAQNSEPAAQQIVDTVPAARDVAWPGVINLSVDASDNNRGIFRIRELIPVSQPGPLTLLYPKLLPGNHSPTGPIAALAGIQFTANG